ncbi:MAG: helix-turn-helix domain-containing protein [Actinomycetota bacterium]|nr:helix-turn-helix domain-containing protein [Actinomycetota bacterium]
MTMNTVERVVETLGRGVLSVVCAPKGLDVEVHEVVVHDSDDPFDVTEGDLVLGVSLGAGPETVEIVADLASRRVAGLVLKTPAASDAAIVQAAEDAGLAVLSIPAGASWAQIVQLVQSVLSHGAAGAEDVHGLAAADLFALADAISQLVDAPVTIEDRLSRVLAYSGRQDEADPARAETIIGRRVPERFLRSLHELGVFKKLRDEPGCVYVDNLDTGVLPRLAVSVRAGDEILGSIWAAVPDRPTPETERAFADTAKVAALHLLRHRAGADVERTLQADLLASILQGTAGARDAALRLGVSGASYRVLAAWISSDDETDETRARTQLRDVLAVHMSTFRVRGAAALIGGLVYALLTAEDSADRSRDLAVRIAEDLATRPGQFGTPVIGIGGHSAALDDVPRSKREAEEALRVVRARPGRRVATIDEVRLPALLARFAEAVAPERDIYEEKLMRLVESDRKGNTAYIDALTSYFDAFGDYTAAAARLHVHANTLRYRLRKAQELSGARLDDPDERLALMLLLRVMFPPR